MGGGGKRMDHRIEGQGRISKIMAKDLSSGGGGDEIYDMYLPSSSISHQNIELDFDQYPPWPSSIVSIWVSKNLELLPQTPWILNNKPKVQGRSCGDHRDGEKWYGYFKLVEEWLKNVEIIYRTNRNFFFSQIPFVIHASKLVVNIAQEILSLSPQLFFSRELDKRMWKCGVQEVVRTIRKSSGSRDRENDREKYFRTVILPLYLDKMIKLYLNFFDEASKCILYKLDGCFKRTHFFAEEDLNEYEEKLVDVLYRVRVCIGDMYRYALPTGSKSESSLAFENYEMARCLRKNYGRAYYQQAVLAVISKETISSLYYFARAHFAISPTEGARNQILEIHSKSFQTRLANQSQYWYSLSKYLENDVKRDKGYKREIWILPYPFPTKKETPPPAEVPPPTKKQHISSLHTSELFDRFTITFTETIGKLFSRIGMDEFEEVAEECLVYFEGILERHDKENIGINFEIMIQIAGLTISILQSLMIAKQKATQTDDAGRDQLKHYLKLATLFVLELYSIVVERLSKLIMLLDWDNFQMQSLSAALMVWSIWFANNEKLWTIPHVRPRFSIRRIEKSRNSNRYDQIDDVWAVFGVLLSNIENLLHHGHTYAFPRIFEKEQPSSSKLPILEERYLLHGILPSVIGSRWYTKPFFIRNLDNELRALLMIRLRYLHVFGTELLTKKLEYLKRIESQPGSFQYICNTKLIIPKDVKDSCGLHERNYWFWVINLNRINESSVKRYNHPYAYEARTIIRKKKGSELVTSTPRRDRELPITDVNKLWCTMNDHGYRSDLVVIARRVVLDTNCFINKLEYVEKLVRIFTYPLLIPVTVALELKGLSKGGMKLREKEHFTNLSTPEAREKIKEGNEISYNAKDALELIEKYIQCFKFVTTRGRIFKVQSIYGKIVDENFDPSLRNDNRILETCVYLEINDKETRKLDTPLRLYRKTVLITNDRGLRVKSTVHEIPTKELESFVIWVENYKKPGSRKYDIDCKNRPFRPRKSINSKTALN